MNTLEAILEIESLCVGYDKTSILKSLSFSVGKGEFLIIAGPNGAGKSTLLRTMAGLLTPQSGTIKLLGSPLQNYTPRQLSRLISMIFQDFTPPYEFTVFDIVALGRSPFVSRLTPLSRDNRKAIEDSMLSCDILHLRQRPFSDISSGEKQRVIIAKALAQQPSVLLLDEPSSHLDLRHQVETFKILQHLNIEKGTTIICVTHDLALAAQYANRFLLMKNGLILTSGNPRALLNKNIVESLFEIPVAVGWVESLSIPYIVPYR